VPRFFGCDVGPFVCVLISFVRCWTYILISAAETERRQTFRDEILGQLPFDLIGMEETLPSVEISVSGEEGTNSHYTLERHDISSAYPISFYNRCDIPN
jgi:hypothetical protein